MGEHRRGEFTVGLIMETEGAAQSLNRPNKMKGVTESGSGEAKPKNTEHFQIRIKVGDGGCYLDHMSG